MHVSVCMCHLRIFIHEHVLRVSVSNVSNAAADIDIESVKHTTLKETSTESENKYQGNTIQ